MAVHVCGPCVRLLIRTTQYARTHDETIVVQGIIDMLAITKDGLIVVDFKTDHISASQVPERAENYREQLELYGRAAQAVLKKQLAGKWLYFLSPQVVCCVQGRKGKNKSAQEGQKDYE